MFENTTKYLSNSVLWLILSLSSHTSAGCGTEALRPPLKGAAAQRSEFSSFAGQQEKGFAGLIRAPSPQQVVQPAPAHTQGSSPRHGRALCPRLAAAHSSGTAAASQLSATTLSAESEIRSWGLHRNIPRLFTGPSASHSAVIRVKGNILEGSSCPWGSLSFPLEH